MQTWNPWHGCTKVSAGCAHCYVYKRDERYGRDTSVVTKTTSFNLPVKKDRNGQYKMQPDGEFVSTCFSSDFFHAAADEWRPEAWAMMKARPDLMFFMITKRPERIAECLPADWGEGYDNVHIGCTCENQTCTDLRLPVFLKLPILHKQIILGPLLENTDIRPYLEKYHDTIDLVSCGGESGYDARLCDFDWVLDARNQCVQYGVAFRFHQTGYNFRKDGRVYHISNRLDQMSQAAKAGIDFIPSHLLP